MTDANLFSLTGPDHLMLTVGPGLDGSTQVAYHDAHRHVEFAKDEVRVDDTELGRQITVTLSLAVDVGSTTFTLLLPGVAAELGQSVPVSAIGVTTVHRMPFAPPVAGQRDSYRAVRVHGTASVVES